MVRFKITEEDMAKQSKISVQGLDIRVETIDNRDYISLTDIVRTQESDFVLYSWLKNFDTVEFLGLWEQQNNPSFNLDGFEAIRSRLQEKRFTLSPQKWVKGTNAIGILSKSGKYTGGTYASEDIALEFCSWLSPVFKYYVLTEFKRLKEDEAKRLGNKDWNLRRELAKANYAIHTDAVRQNLVPLLEWNTKREGPYFASEADLLNTAVFGMTAKQWKAANPDAKGNMRDSASELELQVLANMESLNAGLMEMGFSQKERLATLSQRAERELQVLEGVKALGEIKKLK